MSKNISYDWLVIAETKAHCEGTDIVNRTGNYGFLLTAMDGDLTSSTSRFGTIQLAGFFLFPQSLDSPVTGGCITLSGGSFP